MFRFVINALREARANRQYIAMAEDGSYWLPVDGVGLVRYMVSPSGKKLNARLNNMVYKSALRACQADKDRWDAGVAHGILLVAQMLDQHMDEARPQKDFSESDAANTDVSELAELPSR